MRSTQKCEFSRGVNAKWSYTIGSDIKLSTTIVVRSAEQDKMCATALHIAAENPFHWTAYHNHSKQIVWLFHHLQTMSTLKQHDRLKNSKDFCRWSALGTRNYAWNALCFVDDKTQCNLPIAEEPVAASK